MEGIISLSLIFICFLFWQENILLTKAANCISSATTYPYLTAGFCLTSSNQIYTACLHREGKLCISSARYPEWCLGKDWPDAGYIRVLPTGFSFYDNSNHVYYTVTSSDSSYSNKHELLLQDDGNLVLYPYNAQGNYNSGAVWAASDYGSPYSIANSCCCNSCDQMCHATTVPVNPPPTQPPGISSAPSTRPVSAPTIAPSPSLPSSTSSDSSQSSKPSSISSMTIGYILIGVFVCLAAGYWIYNFFCLRRIANPTTPSSSSNQYELTPTAPPPPVVLQSAAPNAVTVANNNSALFSPSMQRDSRSYDPIHAINQDPILANYATVGSEVLPVAEVYYDPSSNKMVVAQTYLSNL